MLVRINEAVGCLSRGEVFAPNKMTPLRQTNILLLVRSSVAENWVIWVAFIFLVSLAMLCCIRYPALSLSDSLYRWCAGFELFVSVFCITHKLLICCVSGVMATNGSDRETVVVRLINCVIRIKVSHLVVSFGIINHEYLTRNQDVINTNGVCLEVDTHRM